MIIDRVIMQVLLSFFLNFITISLIVVLIYKKLSRKFVFQGKFGQFNYFDNDTIKLESSNNKIIREDSNTIGDFEESLEHNPKFKDLIVTKSINNRNALNLSLLNSKYKSEIQSIINELRIIEFITNDDYKNSLNKISMQLAEIRNDDSVWNFVDTFTTIYPDFNKRLMAMCKDLTNNDIKICMMIYLNLSNKEMAMLTNISLRTIESVRYRLRKKFNLENDTSLNSFIMQI